jgi:hypothetical protein
MDFPFRTSGNGGSKQPACAAEGPIGHGLEVTMGAGETHDRFGTRMPLALKRVVVITVALAAIGYGMAKMGAHSPATPAEAAAAASGGEATVVPRLPPPEDGVQREEDPRPCEPERGITERCTY